MDKLRQCRSGHRRVAVVNRTLGVGLSGVAAIVVIMLAAGGSGCSAAVTAIGGIVAALAGLAAAYLREE